MNTESKLEQLMNFVQERSKFLGVKKKTDIWSAPGKVSVADVVADDVKAGYPHKAVYGLKSENVLIVENLPSTSLATLILMVKGWVDSNDNTSRVIHELGEPEAEVTALSEKRLDVAIDIEFVDVIICAYDEAGPIEIGGQKFTIV